ncbi:MAG: GtrA family protein [Ferruginibacter sp.]
MNIFIKTQAVLIAGSLLDFLVTFLLADVFNCWYVYSNAMGNITGAIAQFILSRTWVFAAASKPVPVQLIRFVLMWIGNIALSAAGVYLITHYLQLHYLLSKLIVSAILGVSYTYLMSKKFVFQ